MTADLLVKAAQDGDVALVRSYLDSGVDVDAGLQGTTNNALIWASFNGHAAVVRLLIERGANLAITSGSGATPLALARQQKHADIEQILLEAGNAPKTPPPVTEEWTLQGGAAVAQVACYPELGKKITQLFNFRTRERITIADDLQTKAQSIAPVTGFDDMPRAALETAFEEFTRRGGTADRDFVLDGGNSLGKAKINGAEKAAPPLLR